MTDFRWSGKASTHPLLGLLMLLFQTHLLILIFYKYAHTHTKPSQNEEFSKNILKSKALMSESNRHSNNSRARGHLSPQRGFPVGVVT